MQIIPAVDIKGGKCVRLYQGKFSQEKVYSPDPIQIALSWQEQGATIIHVVDLDAAAQCQLVNLEVVGGIVEKTSALIQYGGGVRSPEDIEMLTDMGVSRIVLGTLALTRDEFLRTAVGRYGERIVVGLDLRDGRLAIQGWQRELKRNVGDLLAFLSHMGLKRIVLTDVTRDGTLSGPNFKLLEDVLAEAAGIKVIASGGISCLRDIQLLKSLEPKGLEGIIVGKALYEGKLNLAEALEMVRG
ncbi:phosphoribosylformimino-5-aminoimidazole carboxamide ribotide isomerase [Candidatus Hakubella thermalkaliphila]|uniref:1-(5-phosphoribosyl)-5-[(5-phosphoribosylamino)methylideneamino] imidazole-4-carboxamide isomerase n=1 Tax=Candidatus Hakubella thermalkaliphila TaxID=2754717 RepID=A0A6V8PTT8_9ACTN|nr:1-(5-phosphoribosyl)-5-[(5-phosphoribosylamino)methylideneamino]imidazole-4-carboxamide isomerase [Candidatus Hakubella thermalkaliphila]GFP35560.1 phosphoribosylformimino-5-aminoimidazole carboxamide ribotide isomerase [Candidatus Hakubella thermalkaliphila]